jgi:hypothetical protein
MNMPTTGLMEPENVIRESDDESADSNSTPDSRRHLGSGPGSIKRAMSSPNVGATGFDMSAMSAADKKRNKLGYHRTAVACGMKFPLSASGESTT